VILAAALLVAVADPPAAEPYRALGSEPPWSLTIADGRMSYESPGRPSVSVAAPAPTTEEGQTRYQTRQLSVDIMPIACDRGMGGRRYAATVFVTVGGEMLAGCGGAELAPDDLNGTSWHFAEIAGEAVPLTGDRLRDDSYAIDFYAEGFVGYGGCNRFSAGYSRSGDMLTARPPWGSTVGRCAEPVMSRERRLLQILSQPVRVSLPDSDTLLLIGATGTIRLARTRREH
jgi:heat shock protein HslJ